MLLCTKGFSGVTLLYKQRIQAYPFEILNANADDLMIKMKSSLAPFLLLVTLV